MKAFAAILSLWLIVTQAHAHSWYPWECCHDDHCKPVAKERVVFSVKGYILDGRHVIPFSNVRVSPDADYHACFYPTPDVLKCFFAPPGAV